MGQASTRTGTGFGRRRPFEKEMVGSVSGIPGKGAAGLPCGVFRLRRGFPSSRRDETVVTEVTRRTCSPAPPHF